jgi:hypothetical protein
MIFISPDLDGHRAPNRGYVWVHDRGKMVEYEASLLMPLPTHTRIRVSAILLGAGGAASPQRPCRVLHGTRHSSESCRPLAAPGCGGLLQGAVSPVCGGSRGGSSTAKNPLPLRRECRWCRGGTCARDILLTVGESMLRQRGRSPGVKMGAVLVMEVEVAEGEEGKGGTMILWCFGRSRQRGQRLLPIPCLLFMLRCLEE